MNLRRTQTKAFTLIELLVVIAIIALLVSILTPYLTKAREVGRRVVCMQTQRNLAQAMLGFANTHNGRSVGGGGFGDPSSGKINSGMGWTNILNAEWFRADTVSMGIWNWPLPAYTKN